MRYAILLGLLGAPGLYATACEPDAVIAKLLIAQSLPGDITESKAGRRTRLIAEARKAVAATPGSVWAHRAYVDAVIGEFGEGRTEAIEEYDALLAKAPRDPVMLYAAARAKYSRNTAEAIKHLEAAVALQPGLGPAHALLAEIYASQSFRDTQKIREHLDAYAKSCPDSVDLSRVYGWLDDANLQRYIADRARSTEPENAAAARRISEALESRIED
ncbi:MAG: tetratricopeptide repeat protein [Bryobacteraceae bacterium]